MEQLYQAQNLPDSAMTVVQQEYTEAIATAEGALLEIDYLKSALQNYKNSLAKRVNTAVQQADLMTKYTRSQPGTAYNLPGIMADTVGAYDLEQLAKDKGSLETIKQDYSEAQSQTDMYYRMVANNLKDVTSKLQKISKNYNDLINYINQLQTYSKGNLK